jgi:hypothetical protein
MNDKHAVMLRRIAENARSRVLAVRQTFEQAEKKSRGTTFGVRDALAEARQHALFACEATAEIWWDTAGAVRTEYDVLRVAYTTRAVTRELRRLENQQKRVTGKVLVVVDVPGVGDEVAL